MITNESQVRLSVELQGRLASKGANSSSKKKIRKAEKTAKYGVVKPQKYNTPTYYACSQSLLISSESVQYFISDEARVARCTLSEWKKKKPVERLEAHLQILADSIAMKNEAKFTYQVIN